MRELRRLILWNLRCRRGRLCADVRARPEDTLPPGAVVFIEYECGNCGSLYRWDSGTFERKRIPEHGRRSPATAVRVDGVVHADDDPR